MKISSVQIFVFFLWIPTSYGVNAPGLSDSSLILVKPADIPETGIRKNLPDVPTDVKLALNGSTVLVQFKGMERLGLFDIGSATFSGFIPVNRPNYLFASAGYHLYIIYPDTKDIEYWSLKTREKIFTKKLRVNGNVTGFEMGLHNSKKAILTLADKKGDSAPSRIAILNTATLGINEITDKIEDKPSRPSYSSYNHRVHIRPNDNMSSVLSWKTSGSPTGFHNLKLGSPSTLKYVHDSFGGLHYSHNDRSIFTTEGQILTSEGEKEREYRGSSLFGVYGADLYIQIRERKAFVRDSNFHLELGKFHVPIKIRKVWNLNGFPVDRQLLASGTTNCVVFFNLERQQAIVLPLGNKAKLRGGLPLQATVGKKWEWQGNIAKTANVEILDGPRGFKFNSKKRVFQWKPSSSDIGVNKATVSVTWTNGKEFILDLKIYVN